MLVLSFMWLLALRTSSETIAKTTNNTAYVILGLYYTVPGLHRASKCMYGYLYDVLLILRTPCF